MMGHRERLKEGEVDALTHYAPWERYRAGTRRWLKRKAGKRARRSERMRAARARIVDSGAELLDWDGVEREVAERRCGADDLPTPRQLANAREWMGDVRAWAASFPQVGGEVECDRER